MKFTIVLMSLFFTVSLHAQGKTFVFCAEGSPSSFNSQIATDGASFNVTRQIFNRLVEFKIGDTKLVPGLAESWKVSKDNLTFTFKLRKGVKFHANKDFTPTRDFNADDVIWTFERMGDPKHPYHKVGGGLYEYFQSMDMQNLIKQIKRVDDYTVEFQLSRPEAPFLANLAMDFAGILSKEYADKMLAAKTPDKVDNFPIGTGPFMFQSYSKDTMVRLEKHPNYWRTKVKFDKVVFLITVDPNVRTQKLRAGECHLVGEVAPADLPSLKSNKAITVYERPGMNLAYLAFNVEKKPFDNVLVRQAFAHALNKKSYIDAVYLGNGQVAKNPIPPTVWSYNEGTKDYDYNIEKAKELLKKAGFPDGLTTDLWTLPVSRPYLPNGKKMGELMQADLAKAGIKVKLVTYDWPTYLDKSAKGDHTVLQMGWSGDNGDPDNFLHYLLGCTGVSTGANRSRWCHKPYDNLVMQAKLTIDVKKRSQLYKKAQEVFRDQLPFIAIAHSVVHKASSAKLVGYKVDPFGGEYFEELELK